MYDLRLPEAVFWDLTPRQFTALVDRFEEAEYRQNARTASLMALTAELQRDRKHRPKPYTVKDFLPPRKGTPPQTPEEQAQILQHMALAFAGAGGDVQVNGNTNTNGNGHTYG